MNLGISVKKLSTLWLLLVFCSLKLELTAFQHSADSTHSITSQRITKLYTNLSIAESSGDSTQIADALSKLASNINKIVFWERGKELSTRILSYLPGVNDDSIKVDVLMRLSSLATKNAGGVDMLANQANSLVFFQVQDSSLFWLNKAEKIALENNLKEPLGWVYSQMGMRYYFKARMGYGGKEGHRNFDTAFVYLNKTELLGREINNIQLIIHSLTWQAYTHVKEEKYSEGFKKAYQAYELAEPIQDKLPGVDLSNIFDSMFGNYVRQLEKGRSDTLLWIIKKRQQAERQKLKADLSEQLAEKDRQYETSFTKDQLTRQEELNQLQQAQIAQRNLILGIIALLLFGSCGGGVFFYRLNRKNKLLAENNALLVKEQNHRVKNNLQMISSLLSLQANQVEGETKESMLDGSRRVQAIALLHRKLYDDLEGVKEVNIKEFAEELVEDLLFASGKQHIPVKLKLDSITLPVEKSVHLALILNELITNSIKHVFSKPQLNGECLELSILEEASEVLILYKDHSGSFDEEQFESSESLGNQIIKSQSEYLSKKWSVEDEYGFSYQLAISL